MKKIYGLLILTLLFQACNTIEKEPEQPEERPTEDTISKPDSPLKITQKYSIPLEYNCRISAIKPSLNGNPIIAVSGYSMGDHYVRHFFVNLDSAGYLLQFAPTDLQFWLEDFIQVGEFYYALTFRPRTMAPLGSTIFLNKLDKNWSLLWTKKIDVKANHEGTPIFTKTKKNELLVISSDYKNITIRSYTLNGNLLRKKYLPVDKTNIPHSFIEEKDSFYVTIAQHDENSYYLYFLKLDQNGDTLWTKTYPNFHPQNCIRDEESNQFIFTDAKGGILVLDKNGELIWKKDRTTSKISSIRSLVSNSQGYLLSCISEKGPGLVQYDKSGHLDFVHIFERSYHPPLLFKNLDRIFALSFRRKRHHVPTLEKERRPFEVYEISIDSQ